MSDLFADLTKIQEEKRNVTLKKEKNLEEPCKKLNPKPLTQWIEGELGL